MIKMCRLRRAAPVLLMVAAMIPVSVVAKQTISQQDFPGADSAREVVDFRNLRGFALDESADWLKVESNHLGLRPLGDDAMTRVTSRPMQVPLAEATPFLAVAPVIEGRMASASAIEVELRASTDGRNWTDWYDASYHGHDERDPHAHDLFWGEIGGSESRPGELVFFDSSSRYIQYRLTLSRGLWGARPVLERMQLHFISPGDTPEAMQDSDLSPLASVDTQAALPSYVPRSSWGNLSNTAWHSPINVSQLVIHHTVSANNASDWAATVRSFHSYHVNSLGWADIGYHWLVAPTGTIYQGRAHRPNGNTNVIGTHAGGHNSYTMSVSFIGTYTSVNPTAAALESAAQVLAWKSAERGISTNLIRGHRDYNPTACPGNMLYNRIFDRLRVRVQEILDGGGGEPEPPYETTWHRSDAVNSNPWYFGGDAQRGQAVSGDRLYVVSRHSEQWGPHVMIHSAEDGIAIDGGGISLNTNGIEGGTHLLNSIDVDEDGGLLAANLVTDLSESRFRAYYWADEASVPERVVDFSGTLPHRLGDTIAVSGSVAAGTATIWAPASEAGVVYRWSMNGSGNFNTWPTAIHLSDAAQGASASVVPLENGAFFWNAGREHLRLYSADGVLQGRVPGDTVARDSHALSLLGRDGDDLWLAVYQTGPGNENARVVRVPESDPSAAGTLAVTTSLDEHANGNATGDVSARINGDGAVELFVLATNNGLGAYRFDDLELSPVTARKLDDLEPPPAGQLKHIQGGDKPRTSERADVRLPAPQVTH